MERRIALFLFSAAMAEATLSLDCSPAKDLVAEWRKAPARQRITNLEMGNFPKSEKFNVDAELVNAVAEDYTVNVKSNKSWQELAGLVHFVDTQTIAQVIATDNNRS